MIGTDVALALESGEEYELVVTSPNDLDTAEFERRFAIPLTMIGRVSASPPGTVMVDGASVVGAHGWDHFSI
jgi:thiamine monophosphate kinase